MPSTDDRILEVVRGAVRVTPPNKATHARIAHALTVLLARQLDPGRVEILGSSFGLVIRQEPFTVRAPDLALFVRQSMVELDGYFHSAPELVVEVLPPGNTRSERAEKLDDYGSLGVPEVWVVSPEARTVEVLALGGGRLETERIVSSGELRPKPFPEATVQVTAIWP